MGPVLEVRDILFSDRTLIPIWEKVKAGERLTFEDGMKMLTTEDLPSLGNMADHVKQKKSDNFAYFVINRQVNPTNLCVLSCKFCDFAKKKGDEGAYEMTMDHILGMLTEEMHEVHIVGGHHPDWPFEHYLEIVKTIHEKFPNMQIKAFTAAEFDYFEKRWKVPVAEAMARLKEVGLRALPGGGAEVFSDRVRKILFPGKAGYTRWLEIHRTAHKMGLRSNATLLYGHIETFEERIRHMIMLRELQDETGGFFSFIPLEYQIGDTHLVPRQASAIDNLRTIATSRLMLDNFPHIKAYWIMMGEESASMALNFGADDMDGTIGKELIAHAAKASSPVGLAKEHLVRLIRDAGKIPVERDALYNKIKVYAD
ncbi:MAG: aminofutalosine synthase MqnE [Dehalococcoidia bacterium]|nr:aminofutalosine synthase MqnE [Dehalococcoidia bacterium]